VSSAGAGWREELAVEAVAAVVVVVAVTKAVVAVSEAAEAVVIAALMVERSFELLSFHKRGWGDAMVFISIEAENK
jgi:hypothetical protein